MDCRSGRHDVWIYPQGYIPISSSGIQISWQEVYFANEIYFLLASLGVKDREDNRECRSG